MSNLLLRCNPFWSSPFGSPSSRESTEEQEREASPRGYRPPSHLRFLLSSLCSDDLRDCPTTLLHLIQEHCLSGHLFMTKHDRSFASTEVTKATAENLYELGLLNRPDFRSSSSTKSSKTAQCKTFLNKDFDSCALDSRLFRHGPRSHTDTWFYMSQTITTREPGLTATLLARALH